MKSGIYEIIIIFELFIFISHTMWESSTILIWIVPTSYKVVKQGDYEYLDGFFSTLQEKKPLFFFFYFSSQKITNWHLGSRSNKIRPTKKNAINAKIFTFRPSLMYVITLNIKPYHYQLSTEIKICYKIFFHYTFAKLLHIWRWKGEDKLQLNEQIYKQNRCKLIYLMTKFNSTRFRNFPIGLFLIIKRVVSQELQILWSEIRSKEKNIWCWD